MDAVLEIIKNRHKENSIDPIYMEGYNSLPDERNPYKHASKTNLAMIRVAIVKGALSEKQKRELVMWRKRLERTKWSRWSSGHWAKINHEKLQLHV